MRVIGFAGWSGAGKTTLLTRLIPHFTARGCTVSTIKHAHHGFDLDRPGKDSFQHRQAGAREVLVASGQRWALLHELGADDEEPSLADLLSKMADVDVVIVEGFKTSTIRKLEIYRAANGKPMLHPDDPGVVAVATDVPLDTALPQVSLDDIGAVAALVERFAMSRDAIMAGPAAVRPPRRG